jgi:carbon-monoxide dehydrogenase medium subunit
MLAAFVAVNGDGFITDAKIALGSVAPTPIRAYEAEERLKGNTINDILLDEIGKTGSGCKQSHHLTKEGLQNIAA